MSVLFLRTLFTSDETTYDKEFHVNPWYTATHGGVKGKWEYSNGNGFNLNCMDCQDEEVMNWFLRGVKSWHDNGKEDRKFKFYYARSSNYRLGNCRKTHVDKSTALVEYNKNKRGKLEVPDSGKANWGKNNYYYLLRKIDQRSVRLLCYLV